MKAIAPAAFALVLIGALPAHAAPVITTGTGADPSFSGLDTEWAVRARNFDNRGGTWKPIIFGNAVYTNGENTVNSLGNWGLTNSNTTTTGNFSIAFASPGANERGSVRFITGNHDILHNNVGHDADTNDGPITDLFLHIIDSADAVVSLTNLTLTYAGGAQVINLPAIVSSASTAGGVDAWLSMTNFLPSFAAGFTLAGSYSIVHDGAVGDESPRWELKARSGGRYEQVSEPATIAVLGAGLLGLAALRRRTRHA